MEDSVTAPRGYTPDLATLKKYFEDSRDLTYEARAAAIIDQDYYNGNQWTREEKAILQARHQPVNVFNFVRLSINGTLGVLQQGATDPRAYPRTPQDEDSADVASKTLRYIADVNQFDALKIECATDYLINGTMAGIVEIDADKRVTVNQIRWEEFFYDPRSRRKDFRDARYMGVAKWQYADDIARSYPDKKNELEMTLTDGSASPIDETFEDRPKDATTSWVDRKKRRLMVVDLYHLEDGQWMRCIFHAGGILESGPSPYLDAKGNPQCPIEAQSCYVDRDNNRYGPVRDMRGPQDEINKRHSKLLWRLSVNQVQESEPGALMGVDVDLVRKEAARPDGVIPSGAQIVSTTNMAQGEAQLLQEAKALMERFSPNPAILGRQGADSSGRANLIRQQAGLTEQAVILAGIEDWENRIYRQMWDRARQYWQEPMFVRVTDDEGAPEFVGVNQPIMGPPQVTMGPDGMPVIAPTVLGYKNRLAELDVDIVIDSVPDTANVQQEQFQMLAELAKVYGPQEVTFDDMLEVSAMPNKRGLLEKRKQRAEQNAQMGQAQQQLQQRGAMAQIAETESKATLNAAKAQNELMKPQIEALKAMSAAPQPAAGVPGAPLAGA